MRSNSRAPLALLVISCLHLGGTEIQTLSQARVLLAGGWQVRLLCLFEWDPDIREQFEQLGIHADCMEYQRGCSYVNLFLNLVWRIRKTAADVVHVQYIAPGLLSVLAARLAGMRRVFITVHQEGGSCTYWNHLFLRLAASLAKKTIFVSQGALNSWELAELHYRSMPGVARGCVIHNSFPWKELARATAAGNANSSGKVIGYVGRIRTEKGVDLLLRAFQVVYGTYPEARMLIVGDGPQRPEYEALAEKLEIAAAVEWRGQVPRERIASEYRHMTIIAIPSRSEGFGLVALEAIESGIPVVASRVGGLPDILEDQVTGCLVPQENPEILAERLIWLMDHPRQAQEMARKAYEMARMKFSQEAYRDSILGLYNQQL